MPADFQIVNATLVLPDRLLENGTLVVRAGRIAAIDTGSAQAKDVAIFDADRAIVAPGFIDMHVHGGGGADFMDGSREAFEAAIATHARHGTTSIVPTSTVARHEQTLTFLSTCRRFKESGPDPTRGIARTLGAHLYGPYFAEEKIGCHPHENRPPTPAEYEQYLSFSDTLCTATCAPELPGALDFFRAAHARGVRLNAGHSNASWDEMELAYEAGARHVDHFFCAMSNYVSVRSRFGTPMRGGMEEYVLASRDMTTELIADGRHLAPELIRFAFQMFGVDRVALVTDCNRALDLPPGEYTFGPADAGELIYSDGEVGLMPDRVSLASSVRGMDFMVRHLVQVVGIEMHTAVRMATLTPAKILGVERELGSIEIGKRADLVFLDSQLNVQRVIVEGVTISG